MQWREPIAGAFSVVRKPARRNLRAVGGVGAGRNGIGFVPSGNEDAVGPVENQLVNGAVRVAPRP